MASNSKHYRTYEDFEPPVERSEEDGCTILTLYIPEQVLFWRNVGFNNEEIKVQVSSRRMLRISGERAHRNSKHAWQRFHKEFQIPSNCDTSNITAKYKGGILHVRQPLQNQSKPHAPHYQADDAPEKPVLEQTKLTNSAAAPHTGSTPNIPTGRRLKEVVPGVFLKFVLPVLLAAALLLFWYAKGLSPAVFVGVGDPSVQGFLQYW